MKLKKRIILNRVITFILGLIFIGIGAFKNIETFESMGIAMIICSILMLIRQWHTISDPEKLKELENTHSDERVLFIAQKSYAFAFWASIYAEFTGVLVTMYIGKETLSSALGMIVCGQMLIYAIANFFYNRRY